VYGEAAKVIVKRKKIHTEAPPEPPLEATAEVVTRGPRVFRLESSATAPSTAQPTDDAPSVGQVDDVASAPSEPSKLRRRSRNPDKKPRLISHVVMAERAPLEQARQMQEALKPPPASSAPKPKAKQAPAPRLKTKQLEVSAAEANSDDGQSLLAKKAQLERTLALIRYGESFNLVDPALERLWAKLANTADQIGEQLKQLRTVKPKPLF
jgi:hypothetical protein